MSPPLRRCGFALLLSAVSFAVLGCGAGNEKQAVTGKVSGKIMLDGKPLQPGCVLTFMPVSAGTEISSGLVLDDGTFVATSGEFPGIPVGDYRVIVSPPPLSAEEEEALTKKNSQAVMSALINRSRKDLEKVEYPQDAIVPRRYWRDTTTDLTLSVKEGENTPMFELSSEKDAKKN